MGYKETEYVRKKYKAGDIVKLYDGWEFYTEEDLEPGDRVEINDDTYKLRKVRS